MTVLQDFDVGNRPTLRVACCLVERRGPLPLRAIQHGQAGILRVPSRVEAAALRQVGVRAGLIGPSQTARQPGAALSAAGDAELDPDISVDRSGRGFRPVGAARLKL
jgi:hypothetical protein